MTSGLNCECSEAVAERLFSDSEVARASMQMPPRPRPCKGPAPCCSLVCWLRKQSLRFPGYRGLKTWGRHLVRETRHVRHQHVLDWHIRVSTTRQDEARQVLMRRVNLSRLAASSCTVLPANRRPQLNRTTTMDCEAARNFKCCAYCACSRGAQNKLAG